MDKISVVLITCIVFMISINTVIIYNVWIKDANCGAVEIYAQENDGKRDLIFSNDTSLTCIADKKLWLRAKIIYINSSNTDEYEIVSKAVKMGHWQECEDGWYYYYEKVTLGDETLPLIDELIYEGENVKKGDGRVFRLQVEAVDEAWFDETPRNCSHAFKMLGEVYSEQGIRELL